MKKTVLLLVFTFFAWHGTSQSSTDLSKIVLSIIMPESIDGLNPTQVTKLRNKIVQIVTSSGIGASEEYSNFAIYPVFTLNESNVVEGGMQNITITSIEFGLFIKQIDNHMLYASVSNEMKGRGLNQMQAINNAISEISVHDPLYRSFIIKGKSKILQYYESKGIDIIANADALIQMQKFDQALWLLMTVPEDVSFYNQVRGKSMEAYNAYQSQKCNELIQLGNKALSSMDYVGALDLLGSIDPSTSCFKEARALIKKAEEKINDEEKKNWEFKLQQYNDTINREQQKINAIRNIAISYYKSKTKTVNCTYNYIVK